MPAFLSEVISEHGGFICDECGEHWAIITGTVERNAILARRHQWSIAFVGDLIYAICPHCDRKNWRSDEPQGGNRNG